MRTLLALIGLLFFMILFISADTAENAIELVTTLNFVDPPKTDVLSIREGTKEINELLKRRLSFKISELPVQVMNFTANEAALLNEYTDIVERKGNSLFIKTSKKTLEFRNEKGLMSEKDDKEYYLSAVKSRERWVAILITYYESGNMVLVDIDSGAYLLLQGWQIISNLKSNCIIEKNLPSEPEEKRFGIGIIKKVKGAFRYEKMIVMDGHATDVGYSKNTLYFEIWK